MTAKLASLRAGDVRALIAIVGECRDLGDDGCGWWTHFAGRLAALAGAEFGACGQVSGIGTGTVRTLGIGERGWDNGLHPESWHASVGDFDRNPFYIS